MKTIKERISAYEHNKLLQEGVITIDPKGEKKEPEDTEPKMDGNAVGVAQILSDLIKDEWEAIDGYNSAIATFSGLSYNDLVGVLNDIVGEEHTHIGQLTAALQSIDPSSLDISEGHKEGEEQISNAGEQE